MAYRNFGFPLPFTMTFLSTNTVTAGTNLDITNLTNAYKAYRFIFVSGSASNTGNLFLKLSTNNCSTFVNVEFVVFSYASTGTNRVNQTSVAAGTPSIYIVQPIAGCNLAGYFDAWGIGTSTSVQIYNDMVQSTASTTSTQNYTTASDSTVDTINSVRITPVSGTFTATVKVYGLS